MQVEKLQVVAHALQAALEGAEGRDAKVLRAMEKQVATMLAKRKAPEGPAPAPPPAKAAKKKPPRPKPLPDGLKLAKLPQCTNLGTELRTEQCPSCSGTVPVAIHQCKHEAIGPEATVAKPIEGLALCHYGPGVSCPGYHPAAANGV